MTVQQIPKASIPDTVGFLANVILPTIAKGVLIRRPGVVGFAERLQLDKRAVRYVQRMRGKYGPDPVILQVPALSQLLILNEDDVRMVLENSPEPFAVATTIKIAKASHFEPHNVLISHGPERTIRRQFNEQVLELQNPVHRMAEAFVNVVYGEAAQILAQAQRDGELTWEQFFRSWYRVVRVVIFGEGARDDESLTDMLATLRRRSNWAFLMPKRRGLRKDFISRIQDHLNRAEPGSLAHIIANMPTTDTTAPEQQIPQWLFAFDPAGMTTFRALAVLAAQPDQMQRARQEIADDDTGRQHLPFLRACILESLRLWPTTPLLLRESTRETTWNNGVLPEGMGIMIYAPFFHRDNQNLSYADTFTPNIWLESLSPDDWPFVPFSGGPGRCPGRHLVLLVTSAMLAALIENYQFALISDKPLDGSKPLPATLDNYTVRFEVNSEPSYAGQQR
jgi:cytochrome P450